MSNYHLREQIAAMFAEDDPFVGIGKSSYDNADRVMALLAPILEDVARRRDTYRDLSLTHFLNKTQVEREIHAMTKDRDMLQKRVTGLESKLTIYEAALEQVSKGGYPGHIIHTAETALSGGREI